MSMTDPEILRLLGARLRALREAQGLTSVEVAARAGLARRTVYRAERGENPTLLTVVRLLRLHRRLETLDSFLPEPELSPMAVLEASKASKTRKAARRG